MSCALNVVALPEGCTSRANVVYLNSYTVRLMQPKRPLVTESVPFFYLKIHKHILCVRTSEHVPHDAVGMSIIHRRQLGLSIGEKILADPYWLDETDGSALLATVHLGVDFMAKSDKDGEFDVNELAEIIRAVFVNHFFKHGQVFIADFKGRTLSFTVLDITSLKEGSNVHGCLLPSTLITFERSPNAQLKLVGNDGTLLSSSTAVSAAKIFKPNFDFSTLGIGGMDEQFTKIFRRAFAPRIAPPQLLAKIGIHPVKGVLLYGPPGTGKTLMARQIGQMLSGKAPTIVNGPEILDKYVGESEKKVRDLFAPAEQEWKSRGADSDLHVIVLDELDAICKHRGKQASSSSSSSSAQSSVGDTVVNQLLAKMDGYVEQNNVLIIGMTNRKDMIDEALLRPGRLEVHIEIGLPDEAGRAQILKIHTATMTKSGVLADDVSLDVLAQRTKNFSGAELMGLVQNASTYSLGRHVDASSIGSGGRDNQASSSSSSLDLESFKVTQADFEVALADSKPSFGVAEADLHHSIPNGIIMYSDAFKSLVDKCNLLINQVRTSSKSHLVSLLLEGDVGTGKTALAAHLALQSQFPFVRIISPNDMVGLSEHAKIARIAGIFDDSYKSPLSLIIVDEIETLLEYTRVGPRFSNLMLQGLITLVKRRPIVKGHRLMIIGTTSERTTLDSFKLSQLFDSIVSMPRINVGNDLLQILEQIQFPVQGRHLAFEDMALSIPIRRLITMAETVKQEQEPNGGSEGGVRSALTFLLDSIRQHSDA